MSEVCKTCYGIGYIRGSITGRGVEGEACPDCSPTAVPNQSKLPGKKFRLCLKCGGTGKLQTKLRQSGEGRVWEPVDCEECNGTGKVEIKKP